MKMRARKRFEALLAVLSGLTLLVGAAGAAWGAYADNGDGTITDTATGLMWQQADDGVERNWQNALSYCEGLELAGNTDWRLPDIRELQSIVDVGRYDPAINPTFSCRKVWYWSGSTYAYDPDYAWYVSFYYGEAHYLAKTYSMYVRCVRGGPSGPFDNSGALGNAVDNTGLVWTTGGSASWFRQQVESYRGGDAAQSGDISHGERSWMETKVIGPGTLSFRWKVSSESKHDYLRFYVDGVKQPGSISGEVDWQQKSCEIPAGNHTVKWVYAKDASRSSGADAGWVDDVRFIAGDTDSNPTSNEDHLSFDQQVDP